MTYAHAALQLFATVGYPGLAVVFFVAALGIGAPIPVTALLLTLGALGSARGGPSLGALAGAALLSLGAGHAVDFWCGRMGNRLLAARLTGAFARFAWLRRLSHNPPRGGFTFLIFLSRFLLTPVASPISVVAGMARVPFVRYLGLEAAGTSVYVLANLALGAILGPRALSGGGGLLLFWLAVALLTLLPAALLWLAPRLGVGPRTGPETRPRGAAVPARRQLARRPRADGAVGVVRRVRTARAAGSTTPARSPLAARSARSPVPARHPRE